MQRRTNEQDEAMIKMCRRNKTSYYTVRSFGVILWLESVVENATVAISEHKNREVWEHRHDGYVVRVV